MLINFPPADDVFVLGSEAAHLIQKIYYGNVKPEDLASLGAVDKVRNT